MISESRQRDFIIINFFIDLYKSRFSFIGEYECELCYHIFNSNDKVMKHYQEKHQKILDKMARKLKYNEAYWNAKSQITNGDSNKNLMLKDTLNSELWRILSECRPT